MDLRRVDQIIDQHQGEASSLIQVLLGIQSENHWLPGHALERVSERLGVPLARIRHIAPDNDQFVVGLQFIGLEQTAKGKAALRLIGAKVAEFQRLGLHEMTSSGPRT